MHLENLWDLHRTPSQFQRRRQTHQHSWTSLRELKPTAILPLWLGDKFKELLDIFSSMQLIESTGLQRRPQLLLQMSKTFSKVWPTSSVFTQKVNADRARFPLKSWNLWSLKWMLCLYFLRHQCSQIVTSFNFQWTSPLRFRALIQTMCTLFKSATTWAPTRLWLSARCKPLPTQLLPASSRHPSWQPLHLTCKLVLQSIYKWQQEIAQTNNLSLLSHHQATLELSKLARLLLKTTLSLLQTNVTMSFLHGLTKTSEWTDLPTDTRSRFRAVEPLAPRTISLTSLHTANKTSTTSTVVDVFLTIITSETLFNSKRTPELSQPW